MKDLIIQDSRQWIYRLCDFTKSEEIIIKNTFLKISKEFTSDYIINENNKYVITSLLEYFTGNGNLDLKKGIYLHGSFGTGKTIIMQIIRKLLSVFFPFSPNGFYSTSVEQIIDHYKKENNLTKFGNNGDDIPLNICINEFGKKLNEKIYGTDANAILESLFMIRYELFQQGRLTHVTSNFNPQKLNMEPTIKDRMIEMFNIIELKGESFRKRLR